MSSGTALSQEEILSGVKTVSQGLEALIVEHQQILVGLASSADSIKKESGDASFVEQKAEIITKSVDSLELGIGEAQVGSIVCGHGPTYYRLHLMDRSRSLTLVH